MPIDPPSEPSEPSERPALNACLVQWMAIQALQDRYARLADGGADVDDRIELASLFIDLPIVAKCRGGNDASQNQWDNTSGGFPLRVSLPALARWMAGRADPSPILLWDYLVARLFEDLGNHELHFEVSAPELRALVEAAGRILWIFDGLDEVPASAGRSRMIEAVRATVCDQARSGDGVLVSTRPQGYEGEFDDLDELELQPLPLALALEYAERLLNAWSSRDGKQDLAASLEKLRTEFAKPDVVERLQTPLHTTMAALLVASRGSLPSARSLLFEHYFNTLLRRELRKPFDHGIRDEDEGVGISYR